MTTRKEYQLVYQCGIANVVDVTIDGKPRRIMQYDFRTAEAFAAGLIEAGGFVSILHCDIAGDILTSYGYSMLHIGPGELFGESKCPPKRAAFRTDGSTMTSG